MFEKKKLLLAILTASLTAGLTACGGSSGSSSSATANTEEQPPATDDTGTTVSVGSETGRFVDSAVGGIEYETSAGYKDITNGNGEFRYNEGETVSFKLGTLNFGSVSAKGLVTPVDLAANDPAKTANIARVLQTLDDDGIPDNGITITASVREKAALQNPTDIATTDLEAAKELILSLANENTVKPDGLVTKEEAESHLNETLAAEQPVKNCGTDTTPVTESHLAGKTFGFIRMEEKDKEISLMHFASSGNGLTEFHNDLGYVQKKTGTTWSVNNGEASFTDSEGTEVFTACAVGPQDAPYYLIFNSEAGAITLYSVKPFGQPTSDQSYILTSIDTSLAESQQEIVTVDSEMSAEFFTGTWFEEAAIAEDGALTVTDSNDSSTDALYLLAAQGKRIGIYLDFDGSNSLKDVGIAENIPSVTRADEATFSGKTFVYRDESKNETVILTYNSDGTFEDFNNDCYVDGQQNACYFAGQWAWNADYKLLEEYYSEFDSTPFKVAEDKNGLYKAEQTLEGGDIFKARKTQAVSEASFTGSYTIDIPTENTRFNKLVISDGGSCKYSDVACSWTVEESGKAVISFAEDTTVKGNIWQLAGSVNEFAFVMTHDDNSADIEPGYMTRD